VLHYVVKLVQRNDESLLDVAKDLVHAKDAELVVLDTLCGDVKTLKDEIIPVFKTVKKEADELEGQGVLKQLSAKELREQKTSIRNVANVPQYNKIDHHTGRTPMEKFTINANSTIDQALNYTDTVKGKFTKLLEYFGEDSSMPSNEFFKTWTQFMAEFGNAIEHVMALEKMQVSITCTETELYFTEV
jgi:Formin Homology 2 Domain